MMSGSMISPQDLHEAAEQFRQAGKDTLEIAKRLEKVTGQMEKKWEGQASRFSTNNINNGMNRQEVLQSC